MKRILFNTLLCALLLLSACASPPAPSQAPAIPSAVVPTLAPRPSAPATEAPDTARDTLLSEALSAFGDSGGEDFPAEDFLLWLEASKFPNVLSELASIRDGRDPLEFLRDRTGESFHVLNDRFLGLLDDEEKAKERGVYIMPDTDSEDITLAFAGDVNFVEDGYVMPVYRAASGLEDIFSGGLLDEMRAADIFLINSEFAFTDGGWAISGKTYTFRAPPENISIYDDMGVDIAFLGNNHVYDYGEIGLKDTLDTFKSADIPQIGAGMNIDEASRPVYFIINGMKLAYVGAGCIERYSVFTPGAGEDSPGIFRTDEVNCEPFLSVISEAARCSDYVVANLHWGIESTSVLEDYQSELGKMCIDAGADAVIGSHPHVLQGTEFYNGKPIMYSTGNFWFSRTNNYTCLFQLIIDSHGGTAVRLLPCVTGGGITSLAQDETAQQIFSYYQSISFDVSLDSDGFFADKVAETVEDLDAG